MGIISRIRASHTFQTLLRVLQFLSATISLGLFSARIAKIIRITNRAISTSNGAVEGILAAAVAYTLLTMLTRFCIKNSGASSILRWVLVVMDLLFVGAFIAVAVLTRPNGGSSGPCRKSVLDPVIPKGYACNLPWGTFVLAIVSTLLHAITATFNGIRDHHRAKKANEKHEVTAHDLDEAY